MHSGLRYYVFRQKTLRCCSSADCLPTNGHHVIARKQTSAAAYPHAACTHLAAELESHPLPSLLSLGHPSNGASNFCCSALHLTAVCDYGQKLGTSCLIKAYTRLTGLSYCFATLQYSQAQACPLLFSGAFNQFMPTNSHICMEPASITGIGIHQLVISWTWPGALGDHVLLGKSLAVCIKHGLFFALQMVQ